MSPSHHPYTFNQSEIYASVEFYFSRIRAINSRNSKIEILKGIIGNDTHHYITQLLYYHYNPYIRFYVKWDDKKGEVDKDMLENFSHCKNDMQCIIHLIESLRGTYIQGNRAHNLIASFKHLCPHSFNLAKNLINRKLNLGLGAISINKVFGDNFIPIFDVQLANTFKNYVPHNALVEPKFDGVRCIIMYDDSIGSFISLSRQGHPLYNMNHIINELNSIEGLNNYILDGEAYCKDWNISISIVSTESSHKDSKDIHFHCFTIIPKDEWLSNNFITTERDRLDLLRKMLVSLNYVDTYLNQRYVINNGNPDEIISYMSEMIDKGYEGAMLKDLDATYEFSRNPSWQKIKKFHTYDYKVIDIYEGRSQSRLSGNLGGVVLDVNGHRVKCGSGFSDNMRRKIWNDPNLVIDKWAEVQYAEITKDGSLRFPVFKCIRDDK